MNNTKKFLKLLVIECIFMLITIAVACLAALVQLAGKTYIETRSGYIFALSIYRYNILAYIGGIIIYFLYFWFAYRKIMGKYITLMMDFNIGCKLVFGLVCGIFMLAMFVALVLVVFMVLGLSGDMRPECMRYVTYIGWPVVTLVIIGIDIAGKI